MSFYERQRPYDAKPALDSIECVMTSLELHGPDLEECLLIVGGLSAACGMGDVTSCVEHAGGVSFYCTRPVVEVSKSVSACFGQDLDVNLVDNFGDG